MRAWVLAAAIVLPLDGFSTLNVPGEPAPPPNEILFKGLDKNSESFWISALPEFTGNPKGLEILNDLAKNGAALPQIIVKNIPESDMDYDYGERTLYISKQFLSKNGFGSRDLKDSAKREEFIRTVSPLILHELVHARSAALFPRRHAANGLFFEREKQAYAEEMVFIYHKKKKDPAWAREEGAEGIIAAYDAFMVGPEGYFENRAASSLYRNLPKIDKLCQELQEAVAYPGLLEKFPGVKEDLESLERERDYLRGIVEPAMSSNYELLKKGEAGVK